MKKNILGKLVFHVRKEVKPQSVVSMLSAIDAGQELASSSLRTPGTQGQGVAELRRLGLVEPRSMGLTARGRALVLLDTHRPHLVAEAVHALYLRLPVETTDGSRFGAGWAYRQVCASVWAAGNGAFDRQGIIGRVYAAAVAEFGLPENEIAFSTMSVGGIANWLESLEPPVCDGSLITLRHVCPPEAVWWAVDALHHADGHRIPAGVRLPLVDDLADVFCQHLLVHRESLGRVLEQAKRRSDFNQGGIFDTGTAGGRGRWVLLARPLVPPDTADR